MIGEGCHFIDAMSALCGADPVSLAAVRPANSSDSVQAVLRFADGSTGTLLYSAIGDASVPKEEIELFGRGIVIRITDFRELAITRAGKTRRRKATQDKGQVALLTRVIATVRDGAPPPIPLDTLLAVSRATLGLAL